MESPRLLAPAQLVALVAPDVGMERVSRLGRARWPLLFAMVCSLLMGGAEAYRVDASQATLKELEDAGTLKNMSDKQIEDQTKGAERAFIVKRIAFSAIKAPLLLLGSLIGLYVLSWFLRGRANGGSMLAVAGAALLPHAFADLLSAGSAFLHSQIAPTHPQLIPRTLGDLLTAAGLELGPAMTKLGGVFDFFSLWAALLLAFGFAPAAQIPRGKAIFAVLFAWLLWRLLTQVALGG
jgi:Yip1 domain